MQTLEPRGWSKAVHKTSAFSKLQQVLSIENLLAHVFRMCAEYFTSKW